MGVLSYSLAYNKSIRLILHSSIFWHSNAWPLNICGDNKNTHTHTPKSGIMFSCFRSTLNTHAIKQWYVKAIFSVSHILCTALDFIDAVYCVNQLSETHKAKHIINIVKVATVLFSYGFVWRRLCCIQGCLDRFHNCYAAVNFA